jgi:hypothetical protein
LNVAAQQTWLSDVGSGSTASFLGKSTEVRFSPNRRHPVALPQATLCANNRLTQRSKQISSFDHLVSLGEHQNWDLKAEGVSGLEIDHQFYLGALLDWEVSRLGALENFSDVDPGLLM